MNYVFFAFLAGYVVHALAAGRAPISPAGRPRRPLGGLVIQVPLFWTAVYFAWQHGAFSRALLSPVYITLGFLAGHLIFGISVFIVCRSFRDGLRHFADINSLWEFAVDSPLVLFRYLGVAFSEELVFRVAAQTQLVKLTGSAWAGIVVIAAAFVLVHRPIFQRERHVILEFIGFALLLGVLYHYTQSFILVIVVHALRDIEISYLDYLVKYAELGDKYLATRAIEQSLMRGNLE